jgi:hypothetical protein
LGPTVALVAVVPLGLYLWGFTVDDAFIPARVAEHVGLGLGPRFNRGGPITDAVTPLGYAQLLVALGGAVGARTTTELFFVARCAGMAAALLSAAILGADLAARGREGRVGLLLGLVAIATCVPLWAWSGAGLETPWVTLLATWALRRRRGADLAAGLAAAWRPELLPWSVTLVLVRNVGLAGRSRMGPELLLSLAWSLAPALVVAAARWTWFGSPWPLSSVAKAPDLAHGLQYVVAGVVRSGPFWLLLAPWCVARVIRAGRAQHPELVALIAAIAAHLVALVLAGGDWMAFFRLFVPVLPGVVLTGCELDRFGRGRWLVPSRGARLALVLMSATLLLWQWGPEARRVVERRLELIERARPLLAPSQRIAAVDVGWIGAASSADIVDLAGVTDPRVAALPGGHTTKRVAPGMLAARDVDTLVFLIDSAPTSVAWSDALFRYGVEARLAFAAEQMGYRLVSRLPLGGTPWHYVICRQAKP